MLLNNTLQVITIALWALFVVLMAIYVITAINRRSFGRALPGFVTRGAILFVVVLCVITLINGSAVYIEPQEVGIVLSTLMPGGYYDRPQRSGLHWITPMFEQVKRYPIYWQTYTMASSPNEGEKIGDDSIKARTSDGQEVALDVSLIFQLDADQVMRIHIDWQGRYVDDFVRPVTRGIVRTIVSQYQADEVNSSKRLDLERDINRQLADTFREKGFIVDRFILRNIAFSPEYATSIEMKQVALQEVTETEHQADQTRRRAQGEADAVTIRAKADAEALRMIADALGKNKDLLTYQYISKLAPNVRVMLVPNNSPYLLPLPDLSAADIATSTLSATTALPLPQGTQSRDLALPLTSTMPITVPVTP